MRSGPLFYVLIASNAFASDCLSWFVDFPGVSDGNASAYNAEDPGSIPGLRRSLEKGMATLSSIFAWRIPWTGGLQPTGTQRVGHD